MPRGVYKRTPEMEKQRVERMRASRAANAKAKAKGGARSWAPEREAKFKATMARKREARAARKAERALRAHGKAMLLNGPPRGRPKKDGRPAVGDGAGDRRHAGDLRAHPGMGLRAPALDRRQ